MATVYSNNIKKVLISDDVNEKCVQILENNDLVVVKNTKLSVEQLKEEIKKYDCLVVRSATKVTKDIIDSTLDGNGSSTLKLIARAGTGVDNIDVTAATQNSVLVMNALGSNTISAVELTCMMLLDLARSSPLANQSMKEGKWERSKFMGSELYGKCLAVVGLGRIGKEVATRMRSFGMRIIGYDPIVSPQDAEKNQIEFKQLDDLWPLADYITIHVPLLPETKNLVNAEVMNKKCKRGFRLVNCARGGLVDESDLLDALKSGQCAGAGLDVFVDEPTKNLELVQHPLVVCTPHLGASTKEAQNRVALDIAEQIVKYVKKGQLEGGVNYEPLKTKLNIRI